LKKVEKEMKKIQKNFKSEFQQEIWNSFKQIPSETLFESCQTSLCAQILRSYYFEQHQNFFHVNCINWGTNSLFGCVLNFNFVHLLIIVNEFNFSIFSRFDTFSAMTNQNDI